MQKTFAHPWAFVQWFILLCFIILPSQMMAGSKEESAFYQQVTVLSYTSKSTSGNSTFYYGAKLKLSNGTSVELDKNSSYDTYINGTTRWGYIDLSASTANYMKVTCEGINGYTNKYGIRLHCEPYANKYTFIKENISTIERFFGGSKEEDLDWEVTQPSATFTNSSYHVCITAIDILPKYNIDGVDYTYNSQIKEWTVWKAQTTSDNVAIKSSMTYNGEEYPVTSIEKSAFKDCTTIKSLHLPSSIKKIGNNAFSGCSNLERVDIDNLASWCQMNFESKESNPLHNGGRLFIGENEVTNIEYDETYNAVSSYAFTGVLSLQKLTLGSNISSIGSYAFDGCNNLKTIYCHRTSPIFIYSGIFATDTYTGTLYVPRNSIASYRSASYWKDFAKIAAIEGPDCDFEVDGLYYNVVDLANRTCEITFDTPYYTSYNQEEIVIPESVEYQGREFQVVGISHDAFRDSKRIKKLTIPKSIKSIGEDAFKGCTSLGYLSIDNSIETVKADFSGLSLDSVTFTGEGTFIPNWLKKNNNLRKVTFECPKVETVGDSAFYNCTQLTTIELPHTIKQTGASSFEGCEKLTGFKLPQALCRIGQRTFKNCSALSEIQFGSKLKKIDAEAFLNCESLSSLNISESIDSIADNAFNGCTGITTLHIADADSCITLGCNTTYRPASGLFNAMPLKEVYIGRDIDCSSDALPFKGNTGIETLIIGHHVSKFPDENLTQQTNLVKLILGNKLTSVPTFKSSTHLQELHLGSHLEVIPDFSTSQALKKIKVYAAKPQPLTADFSNKTYIDCELYVPKGSIANYQNAEGWKAFFNPKEYESDSKAESLKFEQKTFNVYPEESFDIEATIYPLDASEVYTWESSDPRVATVDDYGHVTSHAEGEAFITATTTDGSNLVAACNVTVKKLVPIETISFEEQKYKVTIGQKAHLIANISPSNASYTSLKYESSDPTIATVTDNGEVHGIKVGKCTITAKATDGSEVEGSCEVDVLPIFVTNLTINNSETQIVEGETLQLNISFEPDTATITDVAWEVSNTTIASVDDKGLLTAHAEGLVSVKATAKDGSTVFTQKDLEVLPLLSSSITANVTNQTIALNWSTASYVKNKKDYNVYVSEDDGPYVLWLHNVNFTSSNFSGVKGKCYRFIVTMRNKDGKTEKYNENKAIVVNL